MGEEKATREVKVTKEEEGKGGKEGKGGGRCQRSSSQSDCDADYCTYYEGYGCYRTKNNSGKGGKGDKGGKGKGDKGGKGKGGKSKGCDFEWSERRCNNNSGCTYYNGFGCFSDKSGNNGNGKVVVVQGRYLRR